MGLWRARNSPWWLPEEVACDPGRLHETPAKEMSRYRAELEGMGLCLPELASHGAARGHASPARPQTEALARLQTPSSRVLGSALSRGGGSL